MVDPSNPLLISVLMPIYNARDTLPDAIESVLNQTHSNFELLVIDDGSTDGSRDIVNSFNDPRIRLIVQPYNLGIVAALNLGIIQARGTYLARMDGDDKCLPERLSLQLSAMQYQQLDICGSHWAQINEQGKQFNIIYAPKLKDEVIATLATTVPYAHGSVMIRKGFLRQHSLCYRAGFAEDYQLWIRCIELGAKFGIVDAILYFHRTHERSITRTKISEQAIEAKKLRRGFVKNNLSSCEQSLESLRERFIELPHPIQVHTLYLAYQLLRSNGRGAPFPSLFLKAPFVVQLRALWRILSA